MPTPRVAAIHDMSGFGRCSLTVAIPVLSAMGVQCCPLPTAYLSTHTGGFTGYTFLDMTDELPKTAAHWAELGIHFDLKPGSLSEILSKLELGGLIERSRNPKDRRQLTIRLTEAGWEKARVEQAARIRFREQAFSALTHDEREQLAEMLEKIRVTWEELDD